MDHTQSMTLSGPISLHLFFLSETGGFHCIFSIPPDLERTSRLSLSFYFIFPENLRSNSPKPVPNLHPITRTSSSVFIEGKRWNLPTSPTRPSPRTVVEVGDSIRVFVSSRHVNGTSTWRLCSRSGKDRILSFNRIVVKDSRVNGK